jgi:DNA replication protein DnaC
MPEEFSVKQINIFMAVLFFVILFFGPLFLPIIMQALTLTALTIVIIIFNLVNFLEGIDEKDKQKKKEERQRKLEARQAKKAEEEKIRGEKERLKKEEEERRIKENEEAKKAEEKARKLEAVKNRLETGIIDENTILIGDEKTPPGKIALGWLVGVDIDTSHKTVQLKNIDEVEREQHFYIVGGSGRGKTKLIEHLIRQDINRGAGFAVIDPHQDLIDNIKIYLTEKWGPSSEKITSDVVLIDPTDPEKTVNFNPLELIPGADPVALAEGLTGTFKKIWGDDSWGPRLEDLLANSLVALSEGGFTLADLPEFFEKDNFRQEVLSKVKNEVVLGALETFGQQSVAARNVATAPILNKVRGALRDRKIRQFFSHPKSTFNLREIMDGKKILLIYLPKGDLANIGKLLGSIMMSSLRSAALSRTNIRDRNERVPFNLYVDEFQNFATDNFLETLSEALKYKLFLVMAHQDLSQLSPKLQSSILGNCKVQIYFKVNYKDAEVLAHQSGEKIRDRHNLLVYLRYRDKADYDFMHSYRAEEVNKYPYAYRQPYDLDGQVWGDRRQQLQDLPPKQYIIKIGEEGAILAAAEKILDPIDVFSKEDLNRLRNLADKAVGSANTRKRADIEKEVATRTEKIETISEDPESYEEEIKK